MFRSFTTTLNAQGNGSFDLSPYIESVEWDIYQVSVQTTRVNTNCSAQINHNGFFLCGTAYGSKDSASGPPDCVVLPSDTFTVQWFGGYPGDQALLGVWYNENPQGSTSSSAH